MSAAAGWYPDPTGAPGSHWWDGTQWTGHTQAPPLQVRSDMPVGYVPASVAPESLRPVDVPTNTVWIWLVIAASTLPLASLLFLDPSDYVAATMNAASDAETAFAGSVAWMLQCLTIGLVSWVFVGAAILFSWLDWRELRRRGVPVPFHWAWALLALAGAGLAVYVIGRTVVLRRRAVAGGWAPLWVWIGTLVLAAIVAIAWATTIVAQILGSIPIGLSA
ncbi:DUF2510 domain-containing protein [Microbacterium sp.]|uniref:DUF2510 domain-containing protein n=1 Tax=Microbacterium sp. TaxID=51671 RepID=UPI0028975A0B|nr:DUF2510 domain-containing protein [Microbacterium sp.]